MTPLRSPSCPQPGMGCPPSGSGDYLSPTIHAPPMPSHKQQRHLRQWMVGSGVSMKLGQQVSLKAELTAPSPLPDSESELLVPRRALPGPPPGCALGLCLPRAT